MYNILPYTKQQAKLLNVEIYPSKKQYKKLDIYKNGQYIKSIGDIRYSDYPTYIKTHGLAYANERRRLFRLRHKNDIYNNLLW